MPESIITARKKKERELPYDHSEDNRKGRRAADHAFSDRDPVDRDLSEQRFVYDAPSSANNYNNFLFTE